MTTSIEKLYVFNKSEALVAVISYNNPEALPFYDAQWTEQINGENKLIFTVPGDQLDSDLVIEAGYVGFFDFDDEFQLFEIRLNDETHDIIKDKQITAEHVGISELQDEFIEWKSFSQTADLQLAEVLENTYGPGVGTRWQAGIVQVGLGTALGINYELANCQLGINKIIQTFGGGEVRYRLVTSGTEITNRLVDLLERRGSDTLKRIEFGKDLKNIQRTIDTYGLYTAIWGYGKSMEVPGGKSRVKFTNVIWTAPGNPLNKPAGQNYLEDPVAKAQFGRDGGTRNRFGYVEFTDIDDPVELLQKTYEALLGVNTPKVTYKLTVADLERIDPVNFAHEKIRLGDRVRVIDRAFNPPLEIETRIVELTRNLSNSEETEVVLDSIASVATDANTKVAVTESTISQNIGVWQENAMMTNLIKDHSFELIPLGAVIDAANHIYNINFNSPDYPSNFWWRWSGGGTPKICSILPEEKGGTSTVRSISPFGFQAAVVDSVSIPYQYIRLQQALTDSTFTNGRKGPYTFSCYVATHGGTTVNGIARMQVYGANAAFATTALRGQAQIDLVHGQDDYQFKRMFVTVKDIPNTDEFLFVYFTTPTVNFSYLLDGVQAVPMDKAAPYDSESGLFQMAQGLPGTTPVYPKYTFQTGFYALKSTFQAVATGFQRVLWQTVLENQTREFHTESDPNASLRGAFVPNQSGIYLFDIGLLYDASIANNTLAGRVMVNGVEINRFFAWVTSGTTDHQVVGHSIQWLDAGDIVTIQGASSNLATNIIAGTSTFWKGVRIG